MKHKINIEEFRVWESEHKIQYASSGKYKREMCVYLNGDYEISKGGEVVIRTGSLEIALREYNSL
jgi:hypothetical protein